MKMKLLLHICCAPCLIYPHRVLKDRGIELEGLYYNPNIHPYSEYEKRQNTLRRFAAEAALEVFFPAEYPMEDFLRGVVFREKDRCAFCYYQRLSYAADFAKKNAFDAFSTTLLYSRFQKHDLIREIARGLSVKHGIDFYYEDFRTGWKEGVEASRAAGMYRQQYCGCIYSEKERYCRSAGKTTGP